MNKWNFYTTNEIKPTGWLKNQLKIQAEGLCGNLDKIWPDIKDSAYIGGTREGFERVPYWLDGFIPLAFLLDDEDMKKRAKKYIYAIMSFQKEDGWICPCEDEKRAEYDSWAVQLISKVFTLYYQCTKDEKVLKSLYKALKNYYELLNNGRISLHTWGKFRFFETFIAIDFLYEIYKEEWLTSLAKILKEQGVNYNSLTNRWKTPLNEWHLETHNVNLAMMLKEEALTANVLKQEYKDNAEKLYEILSKYNGTSVEIFTGDECLSGLGANRGTELCAVVEQMFSYEQLFSFTGDNKWLERLEVIAFNALPATISEDMWTHQYLQMQNQIECSKFSKKSHFRTNGPEAHLYGLEPHFGCCTANFGQGFPKLALASFMHNENQVISAIPIPTTLKTNDFSIELKTEYPFKNRFTYKVKSKKDFSFIIRVPSFAKKARLNGKRVKKGDIKIEIKANSNQIIELEFTTVARLEKRPNKLNVLKCGSLVFALPIEYSTKMYEYEKDGVERKFPYCDYELFPKSKWQYAFCSKRFNLKENKVSKTPFSSKKPAITIQAYAKEIDWGYADGYTNVCNVAPKSLKPKSKKQKITLYPYGSTKLRMTELPLIK